MNKANEYVCKGKGKRIYDIALAIINLFNIFPHPLALMWPLVLLLVVYHIHIVRTFFIFQYLWGQLWDLFNRDGRNGFDRKGYMRKFAEWIITVKHNIKGRKIFISEIDFI